MIDRTPTPVNPLSLIPERYRYAYKIKAAEKEFAYPEGIKLNIKLFPYQVQGVLFATAAEKCLIADSTGLGKSAQCMGVMSLLENMTDEDNRWIVVSPACAVRQWGYEIENIMGIKPDLAIGDWDSRKKLYEFQSFRVLVISYHMLLNDYEVLSEVNIPNLVFDDAHFFKSKKTKSYGIAKFLADRAKRVILTTATPLMKNPADFHTMLDVLGVSNITVGSETAYLNRYVKWHWEVVARRGGRDISKVKIDGWIEPRQPELREVTKWFFFKRTYDDVGLQIPSLNVQPMWLDLLPPQRKLYTQAKKGLMMSYDRGELKNIENKGFHSVMQALSSGQLIDPRLEDCSVKYDAVENLLDGILRDDVVDNKVIIYTFYVGTVAHLCKRMEKMGLKHINDIEDNDDETVGFTTIKGESSGDEKEAARRAFQDNPKCKVLVGTGTIEQAINLQKARHMIMVNLIYNPQRIVQLVGRMRRIGSTHSSCYLHVLLTQGTVEDSLWKRTNYESRLTETLFLEKSEVFTEPTVEELIKMIRSEDTK